MVTFSVYLNRRVFVMRFYICVGMQGRTVWIYEFLKDKIGKVKLVQLGLVTCHCPVKLYLPCLINIHLHIIMRTFPCFLFLVFIGYVSSGYTSNSLYIC